MRFESGTPVLFFCRRLCVPLVSSFYEPPRGDADEFVGSNAVTW